MSAGFAVCLRLTFCVRLGTHLNLRFPNSFRISGIKHDTDNTLHSSLEKLGEKLAQNFRF